MKILNKDIVIKVTGNSVYDKFTFIPRDKITKITCNLINESNLFKPLGKSRIDGYELYQLNLLTIRQIKIDKITKEDDLSKRLTDLMSKIEDDIDYVTVKYDEEIIII